MKVHYTHEECYKYWEKKIRILDAETGTNAGQFPAFAELPVQPGAGTWTLDVPTIQIHYHDFRKQIEGLASLVSLKYHLDPYSPVCVFLFCNKKRN